MMGHCLRPSSVDDQPWWTIKSPGGTDLHEDPKCLQTAIVQRERIPCASPSGQLFLFIQIFLSNFFCMIFLSSVESCESQVCLTLKLELVFFLWNLSEVGPNQLCKFVRVLYFVRVDDCSCKRKKRYWEGLSYRQRLKGVVPQGRRSSVFLLAVCGSVATAPVSIPTSVFTELGMRSRKCGIRTSGVGFNCLLCWFSVPGRIFPLLTKRS